MKELSPVPQKGSAARGRFYVYVIRSEDRVLYVGKGCGRRCAEHLERPEIKEAGMVSIDVEYFPTEAAALEAERRKIEGYADSPHLLNIAGNPRRQRLLREARKCTGGDPDAGAADSEARDRYKYRDPEVPKHIARDLIVARSILMTADHGILDHTNCRNIPPSVYGIRDAVKHLDSVLRGGNPLSRYLGWED